MDWPPRRRRPWAALAAGLAAFLASGLALLWCAEGARPELGDPEYGRKLARLRARRAGRPGRPLVLALGSSRVAMGLRPGLLRASAGDPLVFNFGILQCHPVGELLYLRRLLADGVRPDHLLVEVYPAFLGMPPASVDGLTDLRRMRLGDLGVLERYGTPGGRFRARWWAGQLCPWSSRRLLLLNHLLPDWLEPGQRLDVNWRGLDGWGWLEHPAYRRRGDPAAHQAVVAALAKEMGPGLASLHVSATADRAYRELLGLCRRRGIPATLLLMPEGTTLRGACSPAARARLDAAVRGWAEVGGGGVVDARAWCADEDFFEDIHLTHAGAAAFTLRLEREALPRLVTPAPSQARSVDE